MMPIPTIRMAHGHSSPLPVLSAVITAQAAAQTEPISIGQKFCNMESMRDAYITGSSTSWLFGFF